MTIGVRGFGDHASIIPDVAATPDTEGPPELTYRAATEAFLLESRTGRI
ncbi:hypothetical protein [Bradyrhizobium jicamae]|nr:hypothetical protein [Bradyrhizobium jicamae]